MQPFQLMILEAAWQIQLKEVHGSMAMKHRSGFRMQYFNCLKNNVLFSTSDIMMKCLTRR